MENSNQSSPEGSGSSSSDTLFGSSDPDSTLFEPLGSVQQRLAAIQLELPTLLPTSASDPDGASHSTAATPSDLDARLASLRAFASSAAFTSNSATPAPDHPASSPSDSSDADPWEEALLAAHPEMLSEGITTSDIDPPKTPTAQGSAATVPSSSAGSSTEALAVLPASPEAIQGATVCICSKPSDSTLLGRLNPMQLAAISGCEICLEHLVQAPEAYPLSEDVHTPLCLAIEGRFLGCVKILLKANDAVHQRSLDQSPLQVAASTGCVEIISCLLEHDADANMTTTMHPLAPVFIAASKGFFSAVEILLSHSSRCMDSSDESWTAQKLLQNYGFSVADDAD